MTIRWEPSSKVTTYSRVTGRSSILLISASVISHRLFRLAFFFLGSRRLNGGYCRRNSMIFFLVRRTLDLAAASAIYTSSLVVARTILSVIGKMEPGVCPLATSLTA